MPKVLVIGEYAVLIFFNDHSPAHVHVRKGRYLAKISLELEIGIVKYDKGFTASDLRKMLSIVDEHRTFLLSKWREIFLDDLEG
jgi:hypothetical protein